MSARPLAICSRKLITPLRTIEDAILVIKDGRIDQVAQQGTVKIPQDAVSLDFGDRIIAPGLIDVHAHGYGGGEVGETVEGTLRVARSFSKNGTTSFLATLALAPTFGNLLERLRCVREAMSADSEGADILGIHQEGPFLTVQSPNRWDRYPITGDSIGHMIRAPSVNELHQMLEASGHQIRVMSIAPEVPGALEVIQELCRLRIVPSVAHTAASYNQVMAGVEAGLRSATHIYIGMSHQDYLEPGAVEAVLTCDTLTTELLGDGVHVHPAAMDVAIRCKGLSRVVLVTDSSIFAGLPDGTYKHKLEREVIVQDGKAFRVGGGLAGGTTSLSQNVFTLMSRLGYSMSEALRMATLNPARLIGAEAQKGSLEVGKDADLIVCDERMHIHATMVRGRFVHKPVQDFPPSQAGAN